MKKIYFLFLFLFVTTLSFAQTSVRVINLDVKMGEATEVARLFKNYHDVERKSGAAVIQSANYLDGVTHRLIFAGDPANWGEKTERSESEWQAYIGKIQKKINNANGSMVMTNLRWRQGDRQKNKSTKHWEMIVHEPDKFVKAYDKFVNSIGNILEDRVVSLESIDMGGLGGTHNTWLSGSDLNDLILTEREIQKSKAFKLFLEERGKVDLVKSYFTNNIHLLNKR
jgi:hypothetical protein